MSFANRFTTFSSCHWFLDNIVTGPRPGVIGQNAVLLQIYPFAGNCYFFGQAGGFVQQGGKPARLFREQEKAGNFPGFA